MSFAYRYDLTIFRRRGQNFGASACLSGAGRRCASLAPTPTGPAGIYGRRQQPAGQLGHPQSPSPGLANVQHSDTASRPAQVGIQPEERFQVRRAPACRHASARLPERPDPVPPHGAVLGVRPANITYTWLLEANS